MEGIGCPTCANCLAEKEILELETNGLKLQSKAATASDSTTYSKVMRKFQNHLKSLSKAYKSQEAICQRMRSQIDSEAIGKLYEQARTHFDNFGLRVKQKFNEIDRQLEAIFGKPPPRPPLPPHPLVTPSYRLATLSSSRTPMPLPPYEQTIQQTGPDWTRYPLEREVIKRHETSPRMPSMPSAQEMEEVAQGIHWFGQATKPISAGPYEVKASQGERQHNRDIYEVEETQAEYPLHQKSYELDAAQASHQLSQNAYEMDTGQAGYRLRRDVHKVDATQAVCRLDHETGGPNAESPRLRPRRDEYHGQTRPSAMGYSDWAQW
ncbi:MAG: hypothetical protein MMC33_006723 [Icmadophila ericetorum]|nr:hypothetical protein [Icmadophila ericetorum]